MARRTPVEDAVADLSVVGVSGGVRATGRRWPVSAVTKAAVVGLALCGILYVVVVPLAYLIRNTLRGAEGGVSLDAFQRAYGGPGALKLIRVTLEYSLGTVVLALLIAIPLAFLYARTDVRFKRLLFVGAIVPVALPAVLYAPAWSFLASPKIGLLNWLLERGTGHAPLNVYSIWGMIWIEGNHLAPVGFLLMASAFANMDPSLEESSRMCGMGRWQVFRHVTMPLARPALVPSVLVIAVLALESFDIPALIGERSRIFVFTSRIYSLLSQYPADIGAAGALGAGLLVVAGCVTLIGRAGGGRGASAYQTIKGEGFRPTPIRLGRARGAVSAAVLGYFLIAVVAPILALVYASLLPVFRVPDAHILSSFDLGNYKTVLTDHSTLTAFKNSVVVGVGSATAAVLMSAVGAWYIVRSRGYGRTLLNGISLTPLAIPGVVLGLAITSMYIRWSLPIYGSLWIIFLAYTSRFLPYSMQYARVSMHQIGDELEESAYVCGMSWVQCFRRVLVPLNRPALTGAWLYIFIVSFRELGVGLVLTGPGNQVIPVTIYDLYVHGYLTQLAALGVTLCCLLGGAVVIARVVARRFGTDVF